MVKLDDVKRAFPVITGYTWEDLYDDTLFPSVQAVVEKDLNNAENGIKVLGCCYYAAGTLFEKGKKSSIASVSTSHSESKSDSNSESKASGEGLGDYNYNESTGKTVSSATSVSDSNSNSLISIANPWFTMYYKLIESVRNPYCEFYISAENPSIDEKFYLNRE